MYEQKQRREQQGLRDSLFGGRPTGDCGICGTMLSVKALVAAHKKRRDRCDDDERTDPHIVMPMCLFGCDYLYENLLIRVRDGKIVRGPSVPVSEFEQGAVDALIGRSVSPRWLKDSSDYFDDWDALDKPDATANEG